MSNLICRLYGARGRSMKLYDNKCEITTDVTAGSVLSGNATDGRKTIFYIDCTGVQFKTSGLTLGYLQLETPGCMGNNQSSNFFNENTFTYDGNSSTVSDSLMEEIYEYVLTRIEGYKYKDDDLLLKDLPYQLAKLYGKKRPATKEELLAEERKKQLAAQKKEAEREANKQQFLDNIKSGDNADWKLGMTAFLQAAESCKRFSEVKKLFEESGLSENPLFSELNEELDKKISTERIFGASKREVDIMIKNLFEKYGNF